MAADHGCDYAAEQPARVASDPGGSVQQAELTVHPGIPADSFERRTDQPCTAVLDGWERNCEAGQATRHDLAQLRSVDAVEGRNRLRLVARERVQGQIEVTLLLGHGGEHRLHCLFGHGHIQNAHVESDV